MTRLTRSDDRWPAGVCGGLADATGADPSLVRLLTAVLAFFSLGTVVLVYVAAWLIVPEAE